MGPGRGTRHRGRRLPDQAVLLPGPRRPAAGRGTSRGTRAAHAARGRRPPARPGVAASLARGRRARAHRTGVLAARASWSATRRRGLQAAILEAVWDDDFEGTPTSSRSTCATCATRSTGPSVARRSRRSGVPATGWGATVADRRSRLAAGTPGVLGARLGPHPYDGRGGARGRSGPAGRGLRAGRARAGHTVRRDRGEHRPARRVPGRPGRELRPPGGASPRRRRRAPGRRRARGRGVAGVGHRRHRRTRLPAAGHAVAAHRRRSRQVPGGDHDYLVVTQDAGSTTSPSPRRSSPSTTPPRRWSRPCSSGCHWSSSWSARPPGPSRPGRSRPSSTSAARSTRSPANASSAACPSHRRGTRSTDSP